MKRNAAAAPSNASVESNDSKSPSLVDQWKQHYQSRDFSTKPHHLHRMGLFTYGYCLLGVPLICAVYILPTMDLSPAQWVTVTAVSLFVMAENALNFTACIRAHHDKDVVYCFHCNQANPLLVARGDNEGRDAAIGWRACLKCQRDAPPRSHHCKVCGECVLRRDHHCYFTCCCVGHANQKHFLVLCIYSIAGLLLGCYFVASGLTDQFQAPWRILPPVTVWNWAAGGTCGVGSVWLALSLCLQVGCLAISCIYLVLESILVLRGQTFYEMGRNVKRYDQGAWGNLRVALGSSCLRWPLLMLYPFDAEQSADGVNWRVTKHQ